MKFILVALAVFALAANNNQFISAESVGSAIDRNAALNSAYAAPYTKSAADIIYTKASQEKDAISHAEDLAQIVNTNALPTVHPNSGNLVSRIISAIDNFVSWNINPAGFNSGVGGVEAIRALLVATPPAERNAVRLEILSGLSSTFNDVIIAVQQEYINTSKSIYA